MRTNQGFTSTTVILGLPMVRVQQVKKATKLSCTTLDERYFTCKKTKIVKQAKWHPGSASFSHLAVLTTEDTLRVYCAKSATLTTVWHPERAFLSSSMTSNSAYTRSGMQTLASLGETAIDFDFMAPILKGDVESEKSKVEWPILILRGNGDVFMFTASLCDKSKFKFDGPLPIYPPSDDNYGMEDASSLMVLQTTPPIVVIATSSGNVYHSMLLSFDANDGNDERRCEPNGSSGLYAPNVGLYLFECIELELGFSLDDNAELYSSPIVLHRDPYVSSRYFCTHEAGLHAVILPIVLELDKYAKCDEDEADKFLPSLRQTQSSVEYLICTKVSANETSDSSSILGLQITEYPCLLIAVLASGEVTTLPLISTTVAQNNVIVNPISERGDGKAEMESFDIHIKNILKPPGGTSRPILKLDSNVDLSMDSCIEILNQEMDELRDEYFHRYQGAIKEIERRIKLLSIMKENQKDEIKEIEKKQNSMEQKGEEMLRICEEIAEKQNEFDRKTKDMLELLKRKQPRNHAAQKKVLEKLKEYNATIELLSHKVEETLNKKQYQEKKMQDAAFKFKKSSLYLSENEQKTIGESLRQTGAEIADLKRNFQSILNTTNTLLDKNRRL